MRVPLYLALIALTACGGKKHADTQPVATDDTPTTVEGDDQSYGGLVGDEEQEPPPEPEPPRAPSIAGTWAGPCSPTAADPKVNGRFTFTFTAEAWTLDMQRFSDAACAKRTWAIQETGTYAIGEMSSAAETGAWNADVTIASATLTADDKATAKQLAKICGVKLTAKKTLDISAKGCPKMLIRPIADCGHIYDVIAVTDGELYFGAHPADNDTCTEDKRPTALAEHGLQQIGWAPTGMADCDAYGARVLEYVACDKAPQQLRDATMDGYRTMASAWGDLSGAPDDVKTATDDACKQAVDAIAQGMAAMGCATP